MRKHLLRSALVFFLSAGLAAVCCAPARAAIVINEIMYNSSGTPDVEYAELYNSGATPQDLTGWYLLDDDDLHPKCMLSGTLGNGQYLVVAGMLGQFNGVYPGVTNVNPNPFDSAIAGAGFSLGNTSDKVRLFNAAGALVDSVSYADTAPWPTAPDGAGPSLELRSPFLDNSLPTSWSASVNAPPPGTPGQQNSVFVSDVPPVISAISRDVALPTSTDTVTITAQVADDLSITSVTLSVDAGAGFAGQPMFDDGMHGDGAVGDGKWGAAIPPKVTGTLVRYYVSAMDSIGQTSVAPADAPTDYRAYTVGHVPPYVRINEILASNLTGLTDEVGHHDDWLELRNPGPDSQNLVGLFLSDDPTNPTKWSFPVWTIVPGGYAIVWCDTDLFQGPLHTNFKLAKERGFVGLYDTRDHGNTLIHGVAYGPQNSDVAFGYRPNDSDAPEYLVSPTPGASNAGSSLFSSVCINEIFAASQVGAPDWIELHNRGGATADVSGWHLSDNAQLPLKYTFPASSTIAAGGFLAVSETALGFALSSNGSEEIVLTRADGVTGQDYFDYGPQFSDVSQGRFQNGTPNWEFFGSWTQAQSNSCGIGSIPPGPVTHLRFDSKTALRFDPVSGAKAYDVVKGDLLALRATSGNFSAAGIGCLENNRPDSRSFDGGLPGNGQAWFYVVRAVNGSCGFGTYDTLTPKQIGSRDAEIAASSAPCP